MAAKNSERKRARQRERKAVQQSAARARARRRWGVALATAGAVVGVSLLVTWLAGGFTSTTNATSGGPTKDAAAPGHVHPTATDSSATGPAYPWMPPGADPRLESEPVVEVPATKPTKLEIKDVIKGTGAVAKDGDELTVNYVGVTYSDGEEFDATWHQQGPYTFVLGAGKVIKGWDKGLVGMKVGGRRELAMPAELAFGASGKGAVPPNEPLVFLVDLLAVKSHH